MRTLKAGFALGVRREAPGDLIRLRGSFRLCPTSVIHVIPEFQLRKPSSGSSHVARRHPRMSSSILFSVSVIKYFYGVRGLAARPTPNLEDQWLPFRLASTLWPARHGRTCWGNTPDGIALKVTEARNFNVTYLVLLVLKNPLGVLVKLTLYCTWSITLLACQQAPGPLSLYCPTSTASLVLLFRARLSIFIFLPRRSLFPWLWNKILVWPHLYSDVNTRVQF